MCDLGDVVGDVEALDLGGDGAAPQGGRGGGVREKAMATAVRVGPEDERRGGVPAGERGVGHEPLRSAREGAESGPRGGGGGWGRRPRRHPSRCASLAATGATLRYESTLDEMAAENRVEWPSGPGGGGCAAVFSHWGQVKWPFGLAISQAQISPAHRPVGPIHLENDCLSPIHGRFRIQNYSAVL